MIRAAVVDNGLAWLPAVYRSSAELEVGSHWAFAAAPMQLEPHGYGARLAQPAAAQP